MRLATRFSASVVGVLVLAMVTSVIAALLATRIAGLMGQTAHDYLPSIRAADELEIALLEQRAVVTSYVLDGGEEAWLADLPRLEEAFRQGLASARARAHTPREGDILDRLESVFRQYDAKRDQVIVLCRSRQVARAKEELLHEVHDLYDTAFDLCEEFVVANEEYVFAGASTAEREAERMMWVLGGSLAVTTGLGALLLWSFFFGVVFPLRRMMFDARQSSHRPEEHGAEAEGDELRVVGNYLKTLVSDIEEKQTDLERSRQRLISAEHLATVGKLAASVAHEIRNPLTAVKMWLFSIRKSLAGDRDLDRKFAIMAEEIARLENIICNFLEFSRPPAMKVRRVDVAELVGRTLELISKRVEAKGVRLACEQAPPGLPPVLADPEQLKQVLINILDNASEATDEGGEVRVSFALETGQDGREAVVIRVSDTGCGMPDDVRERIFDPFYTTKDHGTGLGLSIAAQIMAGHRGRLVLETTSHRGSVLVVSIPAVVASDVAGPVGA